MNKWDRRYLDLAALVSSWSKDPSTKTGAVIVRPDNTILSVGYNGFPKRMDDSERFYLDRDVKYSRIVHCEMNAAIHAPESIKGCTLYTYPFLTCDRCFVHMVQMGIVRVVAPVCPPDKRERWEPAFQRVREYAKEAGVSVEEL